MATRKALSKKVRFEVFKRDDFKCQYCGQTPPAVILEVDHVTPVVEGGSDSIDNLLCSCFDCNRGKGATPLGVIPLSVVEKAERAKEAEDQIKAYHKVLKAKRARIEREMWDVAEVMTPGCSTTGFKSVWLQSIRTFLGKMDYYEVLDSMGLAVSKKPQRTYSTFQYFCGICWNKIKRSADG